MASSREISMGKALGHGETEDSVENATLENEATRLSSYPEAHVPPRGEAVAPKTAKDIAPDPESGERIGDYELLEKIGRGGAGSVFRARRGRDGQVFALKVLSAAKVKRARVVQRFFDEVRAASAVKHPSLIKVVDFIEEEHPRRLAYAMEHVDGEPLRQRLKRQGALDLREAIQIGAEVCQALAALHDAGIVHRDLKPENIMLVRDRTPGGPRVKLLDFGVVKFLPYDPIGGGSEKSDKDGSKGTFVGTPRYMAPEQAAGGTVEPQTDLFAVGVLLFEMITGGCPHEGDSLRDVVMAKLAGAPRITVNPGKEILPQELTDVVDRCLKLKPALRPKSAREVVRALREAEVVLFAVGPVKAESSIPPGEIDALGLGSNEDTDPNGAPLGAYQDGPTDRISLFPRPDASASLPEAPTGTNPVPVPSHRPRGAMIAAAVVAVVALIVAVGIFVGVGSKGKDQGPVQIHTLPSVQR